MLLLSRRRYLEFSNFFFSLKKVLSQINKHFIYSFCVWKSLNNRRILQNGANTVIQIE